MNQRVRLVKIARKKSRKPFYFFGFLFILCLVVQTLPTGTVNAQMISPYDWSSNHYDNAITQVETQEPALSPTDTQEPALSPTNTQEPLLSPTDTQEPALTPTDTQEITLTQTETQEPSPTQTQTQETTLTPTETQEPTPSPTATRALHLINSTSNASTLIPPLSISLKIQSNHAVSGETPPFIAGDTILFTTADGICAYHISDQTQAWCYSGLSDVEIKGVTGSAAVITGKKSDSGTIILTGVDLSTGSNLWQKDLGQSTDTGDPCSEVANGKIYCGIASTLTGIDLSTQGALWNVTLDGTADTPILLGGQVFVSTSSGSFFALDSGDGYTLWQIALKGSNVAGFSNMIVVRSTDGNLHALNITNGSELWTQTLQGNAACSMVYESGILIVASTQGIIDRLDPQNGQVSWTYNSGLGEMGGCPTMAITNGYLYANFSDGSIRAISLANGTLAWSQILLNQEALTHWEALAPAIANGMLFAVSPSGEILGFSNSENITATATTEITETPEATET